VGIKDSFILSIYEGPENRFKHFLAQIDRLLGKEQLLPPKAMTFLPPNIDIK
jgi:hypothetical protein